jgi:hypothetical protein
MVGMRTPENTRLKRQLYKFTTQRSDAIVATALNLSFYSIYMPD